MVGLVVGFVVGLMVWLVGLFSSFRYFLLFLSLNLSLPSPLFFRCTAAVLHRFPVSVTAFEASLGIGGGVKGSTFEHEKFILKHPSSMRLRIVFFSYLSEFIIFFQQVFTYQSFFFAHPLLFFFILVFIVHDVFIVLTTLTLCPWMMRPLQLSPLKFKMKCPQTSCNILTTFKRLKKKSFFSVALTKAFKVFIFLIFHFRI